VHPTGQYPLSEIDRCTARHRVLLLEQAVTLLQLADPVDAERLEEVIDLRVDTPLGVDDDGVHGLLGLPARSSSDGK
jgi:hypothetical protein